MAFDSFFIIFPVIFLVVFLIIAGMSGFVFFNVFRNFGRIMKNAENASDTVEAAHAEKRRRALDVVSQQSPGTPAYKCRNCGATVDSTAELSAEGKVRCNYCNQWSSIYQ